MTDTALPFDANGNPMPALRLRNPGGAHTINATASSAASGTFNSETRVVSVYATVPVYLRFGGDSPVAATTDHYFPAGIYYDFAVDEATRKLAVLREGSTDGKVYISEKF